MNIAELDDLLAALDHSDPGVRLLAVMQAADLAEDDCAPFVCASRDADAGVRLEAVRALEGNAQAAAVHALVDRLGDEVVEVSQAAAVSLAEIVNVEAAPVLLLRLAQAEGVTKAALLAALRKLRHDDAAVPALVALSDPLPQVRREAVGVLAYLRHGGAIPDLERLVVGDEDASVRLASVGALTFVAGGAVPVALLAALADPDWQVREAAAVTLAKLRAVAASDALIAALGDSHWQVRLKVAAALAGLGSAKAVEPLIAQLDHPIANLRKEAAAALGAIGNSAAIPALSVVAGDPDIEVRKAAARALEALGAPS